MNELLNTVEGIDDPFRKLVAIMDILLSPEGCPWDREQTHESLLPYLIEETYEVQEDVLAKNWGNVKDELGDVALQIVFHAALGKQKDRFDIDDVMNSICNKMIRRHPHVFGKKDELSSDQVLENWEVIKKKEKESRGDVTEKPASILDGIPVELPALQRAQRMQDKAADVNFDWEHIDQVWSKVDEEMAELKEAFASGDDDHFENELGDLIFALVNLARFKKIWAEMATRRTISKFESRFHYIEQKTREMGRDMNSMTLEELDKLWDEAKALNVEKNNSP